MTDPATFSGVAKDDIAKSIEALAHWLLHYKVGPAVDRHLEGWLAPSGLAEQIRAAQDKTEILAALNKPLENGYSADLVLHDFMGRLLPSLSYKYLPAADDGHTINIGQFSRLINDIDAWRGFNLLYGRLGVGTEIDGDMQRFCRERLRLTMDEYTRVGFPSREQTSPFKTYAVYHAGNAGDVMRAITDFARAADMQDQIVNVYEQGGQVRLYTNFNGRAAVLDNVPAVQALGFNGQLITRPATPPQP